MFRPLDPDTNGFPNPLHKNLAKFSRDLHIHQLFPGELLDLLGLRFVNFFDDNLRLNSIAKKCTYSTPDKASDGLVVPLMVWSSDMFTRAGQMAYFGDRLGQINSNLTWDFLEYDDFSWQVLYQYPKFLSRRMSKAKSKVVSALETYFGLPAKERKEEAWFITEIEYHMRQLGINTHDIATMMMTIYWG